MAYIKVVPPADATGALAAEYAEAQRRAGYIAHILRVQSLNPAVLHAGVQLYIALMHAPSALSRAQKELIATVVSRANDCHYWTQSHGEDFRRASGDASLARQVMADYTKASLDEPTRALLHYCVRLTHSMDKVSEADIVALRSQGWNDEQIHDAVQVTGFFNYYTRLAEALGVDDEDFFSETNPKLSR